MATSMPALMQPSLPDYLIRPLSASDGSLEIRLLDILPGHNQDAVRCEIRILQLNNVVQYEALSYTWGEHLLEHEIDISGHCVRITHNLYKALHRLRNPATRRTLWIDQLCINQTDHSERASQVAIMRTIYARCQCCIIWLGELDEWQAPFSEPDAQAVIDFMHFAASADGITIRQDLPVLFEDTARGDRARAAFEACSMYGNPWWSRVWTIQEAIIPPAAQVVWGRLSLSRESIYSAVRNLRVDLMGRLFSAAFCALRVHYAPLLRRIIYPVRGFLHQLEGEGALDCLMRWRHRESSDPRDKVYALRGLLPAEEIPSAVLCSYEIPASLLFERVTLDLILRERGLRALLGAVEMPHVTDGLASWAIDFACCNRVGKRQLKWWTHSHRYHCFDACGGRKLQSSTLNDGKTLVVSGVFVDQVDMVGEVHTVSDMDPMDGGMLLRGVMEAHQLLDKYKGLHKTADTYRTGQPWAEVFWRTLVGDLVMKEFPIGRVKPEHGNDFNSLLSFLLRGVPLENSLVPLAQDIANSPDIFPGQDLQTALESMAYDQPAQLSNILYESLCGMLPNHAFFITSKGYIGIGPPGMRTGDQVWVLNGGRVPFIMRQFTESGLRGTQNEMVLVGDAYVHGIMDGEARGEVRDVWIW